MENAFLYTLPQWFIFSAIMLIVYGWVEDKKVFRLIGCAIFLLLGIYAAYCLSAGFFAAGDFLTPDEIASEEIDNETVNEIPFLAKLVPAYWIFVVSALLSIPAFWFDWKNKKPTRLFVVLAGLVSLAGFFIIVDALKAL